MRQDVATDKVRKASRSRASDSPSPDEDTDIRTARADVEYKFQGQEAPIVIYSLTTSTHADVAQAFESSFYQLLRRFREHVAAIKEGDSYGRAVIELFHKRIKFLYDLRAGKMSPDEDRPR